MEVTEAVDRHRPQNILPVAAAVQVVQELMAVHVTEAQDHPHLILDHQ